MDHKEWTSSPSGVERVSSTKLRSRLVWEHSRLDRM